MSSAQPVDVHVDLDEIRRIAQDLTSLTSQLAELAQAPGLQVDPDVVGSPELTDALARFLAHWKSTRDELARSLDAAREQVRSAADEYRVAEQHLTLIAAPTGGPQKEVET